MGKKANTLMTVARPVALMQRFLVQKTDALTAFVSHHDSGFFSLYRLSCSPKYIKTSVCTVWFNCCSSSSSSSLAPQSDDPSLCWMSGDVALFAGVVMSSSAVSVSAVCPQALLSQVPRFESCFGPARLPQEAGRSFLKLGSRAAAYGNSPCHLAMICSVA